MADEQAVAPAVDLAAVQAEVAKLTPAQIAEELTKVRVRQKTQQKKQYEKGTMKAYQLKNREKQKQMKAVALATPATEPGFANLWEQINSHAETQAQAKFEESLAVADNGGDEEEAEATA
jgi:hypothetical protein